MFLNPAANPRPLRSEVVAEGSGAIGEKGAGSGRASSSSACREHAVMTSRMLTPSGMTVWVMPSSPSTRALQKAHLDRIDPEFGGKPIDRRLDRKVALRPTEAAEGAAGTVVV